MADPAGAAPPRALRLVLASASPRRLALLRQAGLDPTVRVADVDEAPKPGEPPEAYVLRLARAKAAAAARGPDEVRAGEVVLAADTTVVHDGTLLGKPRDAADAGRMLARLSGTSHEVLTSVVVIGGTIPAHDPPLETLVRTRVEMVALTPQRIAAYVATGEPLGKAGGYAIQGRAGAFVARIDGSYTNVVGLPLAEALALLDRAGLAPP